MTLYFIFWVNKHGVVKFTIAIFLRYCRFAGFHDFMTSLYINDENGYLPIYGGVTVDIIAHTLSD